MITTDNSSIWAEAGDWGYGSALVIMKATEEVDQMMDPPTVLVDVDIADHRDEDVVAAALAQLGYREIDRQTRGSSDYGSIITIEAL